MDWNTTPIHHTVNDQPLGIVTQNQCAFSDVDRASDETNRRSISGCAFSLYGSLRLVSWSAVKQKTVALSSTDN